VDGWGVRNGWIGGQREKVREVYGFSSLVKQNKKAENYAVFCFAGKRNYYFIYYAVITWQFFNKRSSNYYLRQAGVTCSPSPFALLGLLLPTDALGIP
jgi:hypothetical protein